MRRPGLLLSIALILLLAGLGGFKWWKDRRNERRLAELTRLLNHDLDEYEKQVWRVSPPFGEPVKAEFVELLRVMKIESDLVENALLNGPTDVSLADSEVLEALWEPSLPDRLTPGLLAWLGRRERVLAAALDAARAESVGPWKDIRNALSPGPHLFENLWVAQDLIRVDAVRQANAGRSGQAVDRILALDRLAENLRCGAYNLRTAVALGARRQAVQTALDLAACGVFNRTERRRLDVWAAGRVAKRSDFADRVRAEILFVEVAIRAIAAGDVDMPETRPRPAMLPKKVAEFLPDDPSHVLDVWEGVRHWAPRLRQAAGNDVETFYAEWDRMVEDVAEEAVGKSEDFWRHIVDLDENGRVLLHVLQVALRILDRHERHGTWPDSLADLDPPALEGRKWAYRLDPETKKPVLDVEPPLDDDPEDRVPLFRVR